MQRVQRPQKTRPLAWDELSMPAELALLSYVKMQQHGLDTERLAAEWPFDWWKRHDIFRKLAEGDNARS